MQTYDELKSCIFPYSINNPEIRNIITNNDLVWNFRMAHKISKQELNCILDLIKISPNLKILDLGQVLNIDDDLGIRLMDAIKCNNSLKGIMLCIYE